MNDTVCAIPHLICIHIPDDHRHVLYVELDDEIKPIANELNKLNDERRVSIYQFRYDLFQLYIGML
jgi:hypothetical protein